MKICTGLGLGDIIMDVKFKFEKKNFRDFDFDVIGCQNSPFDFAHGPYHSAALPTALPVIAVVVINGDGKYSQYCNRLPIA